MDLLWNNRRSAWAIDNITIPVRPYSDQLEWTDGLGEPGEYIIRDRLEAAYTFAPHHQVFINMAPPV
jgi:hypothetical protein